MIDLHTHILPGIDDGPRTLEESLAMARAALADGITLMAATPHSPESPVGERYSVVLVREQLVLLREALAREQIGLELLPGTELFYGGDLPTRLRAGTLLPYGTSHAVLLECPGGEMPQALPQVIFELQAAGYRVLLAHPERLKDVQRKPELLAPLVERGVLIQVTADALAGQQGELLRATAEALLLRGLLHVLATDTHGATWRAPKLSAARDRAAALAGQQVADALVLHIPRALLEDKPIQLPPLPPQPTARRWRFWER